LQGRLQPRPRIGVHHSGGAAGKAPLTHADGSGQCTGQFSCLAPAPVLGHS
jgi:hypothetical protein